MPREKSAGAVVFRREKGKIYYLLLHYEAGHWDFPKGHIEKGESEIETMRREVEEETGIKDLEIIDGFKEYIKYFFKNNYSRQKDEWVFKIVVYYLGETKTKEVNLSFEHIGYKWLSYKEAIKQITYKNAKEVLKKAESFLRQREKNKEK